MDANSIDIQVSNVDIIESKDYRSQLKKIVKNCNKIQILNNYEDESNLDKLLLKNSLMCSKYKLNDELGDIYKKVKNNITINNKPEQASTSTNYKSNLTNLYIASGNHLVKECDLCIDSKDNNKTEIVKMDVATNDPNYAKNNDKIKINATSVGKCDVQKKGKTRRERRANNNTNDGGNQEDRLSDKSARNKYHPSHKRGERVNSSIANNLDDNLNAISIGEDITTINSDDILTITPPKVEIVDNNLISTQGYITKKNGTVINICNTDISNRLAFSITINRERVDVFTKLLSTAAIKSADVSKTVAIVVTKKAFYVNIISYVKNMEAIVEISPKILMQQRCIKIPLQSPVGSIKLACTNFENFIKCIARANDHKNGMTIDFYNNGIIAKSDWKMDVNKEALKLIMVQLDGCHGFYRQGIDNVNLIPLTCTNETSNCFNISLSDFRAAMSSLKKIIPKGVEQITLDFYATTVSGEIIIMCSLNPEIKMPITTNAKMLMPESVSENFIKSIALNINEFIKISLLTKSETFDFAFVFLRKNSDYFDFTYYTKLDIEANTRLPITDFVIGEL